VEIGCASESWVNTQQTAWCHNPEDHNVNSTDDENKERARETMHVNDMLDIYNLVTNCIRAFMRHLFL
jgi:hypothetical protein